MALLIQITDTHIIPPGELLYGSTDTAAHLEDAVGQINRIRPKPDVVLITGDLVDSPDELSYQHFIELIKPLEIPAYVIPGNHDNPQLMLKVFADTPYFPVSDDTFQYGIENLPCRILALNSHAEGTELAEFDERRLSWLQEQLGRSVKPVLIAIHHPPMTTGIEFFDLGGLEWIRGFKSVLAGYPQVKLVICGHCHTDISSRIGQIPVYMAPATAYQLIAARGMDIAPSTVGVAAPPVLHQFINGDFVSGSYPWPANVEEERIDKKSGYLWDELKAFMMGSRS